ncbi:MAG: glutathione S-transferase [Pseudomonadota bacterium]
MKLAYSPTSPYVRKVMVLLHETDQLDTVELIARTTTPIETDEALLHSNPLGKVPALEREEGPALYDSRVICAYLNERAGASLYGKGAFGWDIRTLEATADGILDAALLMVYEGRLRPQEMQMAPWVEGQWDKVARACAALNTRWMSHLQGPLNMGQIAVGCALAYVDFRLDVRGWRQGNDALAAWFDVFDSRASMAATRPPTA